MISRCTPSCLERLKCCRVKPVLRSGKTRTRHSSCLERLKCCDRKFRRKYSCWHAVYAVYAVYAWWTAVGWPSFFVMSSPCPPILVGASKWLIVPRGNPGQYSPSICTPSVPGPCSWNFFKKSTTTLRGKKRWMYTSREAQQPQARL